MKCITETSVYSVSFIKIRQILAQPSLDLNIIMEFNCTANVYLTPLG